MEEDYCLTAKDREQRLKAMREHFEMTDDEMIEQYEATGVVEDPREPPGNGTSPHVCEWLVLLGRGDLLVRKK